MREEIVALKDDPDALARIYGILNGTTNYILTRMTEDGGDFQVMLKRAQELGFAEADPAMDVTNTKSTTTAPAYTSN